MPSESKSLGFSLLMDDVWPALNRAAWIYSLPVMTIRCVEIGEVLGGSDSGREH